MIAKKLILCCATAIIAGPALAQVELKTYADRDGYVDVQKLTCAQLANTFQEDADYLTVWYSGWYNGLAKKHMMQVDRAKSSSTRSSSTARQIPARRSLKPSTWSSRSTGPRRASK
ncbi:HdeA/HdeB family chaperone [Bradyrhizobium sp. RDT10]